MSRIVSAPPGIAILAWFVASCSPASTLHPHEAPVIIISAADSTYEGTPTTFDARASYDPDSAGLTYRWDFGDGETASGAALVSHAYVNNGRYAVQLIAKGSHGLADTASLTVTVINAPPEIVFSQLDTLRYVATVTARFRDPGALDSLSAMVDWFDGTTSPMVDGRASHAYKWAGSRHVVLTVQDNEGATASKTLGAIW